MAYDQGIFRFGRMPGNGGSNAGGSNVTLFFGNQTYLKNGAFKASYGMVYGSE